MQVSPGAWIRIPIPGEPFPVYMQVGQISQPAFIDHETISGVHTAIAAVRCPLLAPGDYPVIVSLPGGDEIETVIEVV